MIEDRAPQPNLWRDCTSSKPFGQKVLKIKRVFGSSGLPFKLPFVGRVTAGAVRAYAA